MTRKNSIARNMLIIILIVLCLIFAILPNYNIVYADAEHIDKEDYPDASIGGKIVGSLLKQILQLVASVGDIIMGAFNKFMLGAEGFSSVMLPQEDENLKSDSGSWLTTDLGEVDYDYGPETLDTSEIFGGDNDYEIPNFLYSPEAIFSNNIAALDINFLNPNKYTAISDSEAAEEASKSSAGTEGLRKVIADWYISFRNIAIVGLLLVLIYLGIRIVLSSTAGEKAKYKENLLNWIVALCLVFFIHYMMSGLLMITDKFNDFFEETANQGIVIQSSTDEVGTIKFKTNLIGFIRFNAQSKDTWTAAAYTILYLVIIVYTCRFTFMYFKRFLYMAFLTMIAPLVALTYPLDKIGDGKAQAFNSWFKEYVTHLILQPVHLILYVVFVSSAMDLVKNNIIYGLVAIGFLIPAEKLIKEMFNLGNGAKTVGGFGSFAGGVLAKDLLDKGISKVGKSLGGGSDKSGSSGNNEKSNNKIRTQNRDFAQSFANDDENTQRKQQLSRGQDGNSGEEQGNSNAEQQAQSAKELKEEKDIWQGIANNPNELPEVRGDAQREADQMQQKLKDRKKNERKATGKKVGKKVLKGAAKGVKGAYKASKKVIPTVAGAVGGVAIGAATGIATGDPSKALKYASIGATSGIAAGRKVGNLIGKGEDFTRTTANKARYNVQKMTRGIGYATEMEDQRQNNRARKEFMKDKAERDKFEAMAGRISRETGENVKAKELMEKAFDYQVAGITDDKQIENGLRMETKYKGNKNIHENMIDVVGMAKDYGRDYVLDDKKRGAMQDTIKSNVKGDKNQDKVWDLYTEVLGFDSRKMDKKYRLQRPSQNK